MDTVLERCRFCWGAPKRETDSRSGRHRVVCVACGATTPWLPDDQRAQASWHRAARNLHAQRIAARRAKGVGATYSNWNEGTEFWETRPCGCFVILHPRGYQDHGRSITSSRCRTHQDNPSINLNVLELDGWSVRAEGLQRKIPAPRHCEYWGSESDARRVFREYARSAAFVELRDPAGELVEQLSPQRGWESPRSDSDAAALYEPVAAFNSRSPGRP